MSSDHCNLTFAGTSFLGVYNIGSAVCMLDYGKEVVRHVRSYGGTSAGASTACVMLSAPERLPQYLQSIYGLAASISTMQYGAVTPGYDLMSDIREILQTHLKEDAHTRCTGRLHVPIMELVSMTPDPRSKTTAIVPRPTKKPNALEFGGKTWACGDKKVVTSFSSREELIEVLLASMYVPWFSDWKAPSYQGKFWVDGSLLNTSPGGIEDLRFPAGTLITISPNKQAAHSRPQDNITSTWKDISHEHYEASPFNMYRVPISSGSSGGLEFVLNPPPRDVLEKLYDQGKLDAREFLNKYGVYEGPVADKRRTDGLIG
ncbi:patatin-like phospholipase domain-containing protein 4 isoform X2 [Patiria miniata]|nr:patatin-like phospholipase domain-containing protein 4 isoform X2 [Patiria miniata]